MVFSLMLPLRAADTQHFIIYGQSLSTGQQSWPPLSTTPVPGNFMIGNQVWYNYGNASSNTLSPLVSTVANDGYRNQPKTRGGQRSCECPIVSAVNYIQSKTGEGKKFIASSCGFGGQTVEQLSKENWNPSLYHGFTNLIASAGSLAPGITCPAIFWMQGEYNYAGKGPETTNGLMRGGIATHDKDLYKSRTLTLKENMQSDIMASYHQTEKPLFITYQTGGRYTAGPKLMIGMAQLEEANDHADIVCAGPTYPVTDRGGHLDPNGYRWYGEMLGKAYCRSRASAQKFIPLQPAEIARTSDPKSIEIRFYVPKPPLVLEHELVRPVTNEGFIILLNGVKQEIEKVSLSGDSITLTCKEPLTGEIEVSYAGAEPEIGGRGNLRDSDPEIAISTYLDLDQKNPDGTFLYERDPKEKQLRPDFEPKQGQQVIYGKPYPLYNYSLAFYYKLKSDQQTLKMPNLP
jgi:hypothetical protein